MRDLLLQALAHAALIAAITYTAAALVIRATPGGNRPPRQPEYVGRHREAS